MKIVREMICYSKKEAEMAISATSANGMFLEEVNQKELPMGALRLIFAPKRKIKICWSCLSGHEHKFKWVAKLCVFINHHN